MLERKFVPNQNSNSFSNHWNQTHSFTICGYKLPRLFVMIMCILVTILLILIFVISRGIANDESLRAPMDIQTTTPNTISNTIYMKNKVTSETAPRNIIPVLIFCHARHKYLSRTLKSVFAALHKDNWIDKFAVFISQDGNHKGVQHIIQKYATQQKAFWLEFDYSSTSRQMMKGFEQESWRVYHKISAHYKWALNKMLIDLDYRRVVILEEDMELSPDFFSYFYHLAPLMDMDPSIYCISAWNDYGQKGLVQDAHALYRTDVFPGLGWMLSQDLWNEFRYNFSLAFWDDWFREPKQTKTRSCIRPDISRTHTFGEIGSSGGTFYYEYLKSMVLSKEDIDWSTKDVSYLLNANYDQYLQDMIANALTVTEEEVTRSTMWRKIERNRDCVLYYHDLEHYSKMSKRLRIMQDHKFGLPRQSYRGIVIVYWKRHKLLFVPKDVDWTPRDKYKMNKTYKIAPLQGHDKVQKETSLFAYLWNFFTGPLNVIIDVRI
eukprot:499962_1